MADRVEVESDSAESPAGREPVTGIRPSIHGADRDASGNTEEIDLEPEVPALLALSEEPAALAVSEVPAVAAVSEVPAVTAVSLSDARARSSVPPPPPPVSSTRPTNPPRSVRELREALRSHTRSVERGPTTSNANALGGTAAPSSPGASAISPALAGPQATEVDRLRKQLREREARLSELEAILDQRAEALIAAEVRETRLLARVAELEARFQEREASSLPTTSQANDIDTRSADPEPAAWAPTPADDVARARSGDDLRLIRGIGPGYQRALVALGIETFARIADWTPEDVATVSRQLGIAAGRIERDRWIEQARSLVVDETSAR